MRLKIIAAGVAIALLGGCTLAQKTIVQGAVQGAMEAKDTEAKVLKQGLCAMGVGAKNRNFNTAEKQHIEGLCGGDGEATISAEDLRALGALFSRMSEPPE